MTSEEMQAIQIVSHTPLLISPSVIFFFFLLLLSFFKSDRTEREADEEESATTASVLARQTVCVTVRRSVLQRRDLSILQVYSFPSLFATLHAGHVW